MLCLPVMILSLPVVSHRATVVIYRLGAFGTVTIDWRRGFPQKTGPNGYDPGVIQPTSGSVTLQHGIDEASITVQVCIHTHTHTHATKCTHTPTHTQKYVRTRMHSSTHTQIHTHTCKHTQLERETHTLPMP